MGNNCCSSKKKQNQSNGIDYDSQLQDRYEDSSQIDSSNKNKIEDVFQKTPAFIKYLEQNLSEDVSKQIDQFGILNFQHFLKVYKAAMIWNRISFQKVKTEYVKERREALKNGDNQKYAEIMQTIVDVDEACMQDVLEEVLAFIQVSDKKFNQSLDFYMEDPEKLPLIQKEQEDSKEDRGEHIENEEERQAYLENLKIRQGSMTKKEVLSVQKVLQDLSIQAIKDLKKLPPAAIQNEIRYLPHKLVDNLFLKTGVEQGDLDFNTQKLDLENDQDYKDMLEEYNAHMELLQKQ